MSAAVLDFAARVLDNLAIARHDHAQREQEQRSALEQSAYGRLSLELLEALAEDPGRIVSTPGFGIPNSAAGVISDQMCGDDSILIELLSILDATAQGLDTRKRAAKWRSARVAQHAAFHAADLADQEEGFAS